MAVTIQPPQPGDLITSQFVKDLIDELVDLDQRLALLEGLTPGGAGKVAISRIVPDQGIIGDTIQIQGVNFGLPAENIVVFEGAQPIVPTSGNDRQLNVSVPAVNVGTAGSKTVAVTVTSSGRGSDSASFTVNAAQATIPAGTITVTPGQIPANIQPGQTVIFPFTIGASVNMDETFNLVPSLPDPGANKTAWTAIVTSDSAGQIPIQGPLFIPKPPQGQLQSVAQVFVKLTIPVDAAVTAPFVKLAVSSVHNPPGNAGSPSNSFQANFTFGGQAQGPQTISFSISLFTGVNVKGDVSSASFPLPTPVVPPINGINYLFHKLQAGKYDFSLEWADTANNNHGWVASFGGNPATGTPVLTKTITMNAPGDWGPEKVAIVGVTGATPNTLKITVESQTNPTTDFGILNQGIKGA
ncbi:MAG TPA: IPT/TIG domain-containing protein [Myxococcales bacterium]|jgi:hypothetical protein